MKTFKKLVLMLIISLGIFAYGSKRVNADEESGVITKTIEFKADKAEKIKITPGKTGIYEIYMGETGFKGRWTWYDSKGNELYNGSIDVPGYWVSCFYMVAGKTYYFELISYTDISMPVKLAYYSDIPKPDLYVFDNESDEWFYQDEISKLSSEGIVWDIENSRLTLDNVNCRYSFEFQPVNNYHFYVDHNDLIDVYIVTVEVKGDNVLDISDSGLWSNAFYADDCYGIKIIGDGKLNIIRDTFTPAIRAFNVEFDGPTINFLTTEDIDWAGECVDALNDIVMNSGFIYAGLAPRLVDFEGYNDLYECLVFFPVFEAKKIIINDGNIIAEYKSNYDVSDYSLDCYCIMEGEDSIEVLSGTIIMVANEKIIKYFTENKNNMEGICHLDNDGENITIDKENVNIYVGQVIELSNIDMCLDKTEYIYDGKAKKPKVVVPGLREGIDYEVTYSNNVNVGMAKVTVKAKEESTIFKGSRSLSFEIIRKGPNKGTVITDKYYKYKVIKSGTSKENGRVSVIGLKKKKLKKIKIKDEVKIDDVTYMITSIGKGAFKNNIKIKKVYIGKNIKKIGKYAFKGDKKLKRIVIKTTLLKKKNVGKKAFYKISKKLVVKVPKGKVKAYRKIIRARGSKKAKIK